MTGDHGVFKVQLSLLHRATTEEKIFTVIQKDWLSTLDYDNIVSWNLEGVTCAYVCAHVLSVNYYEELHTLFTL